MVNKLMCVKFPASNTIPSTYDLLTKPGIKSSEINPFPTFTSPYLKDLFNLNNNFSQNDNLFKTGSATTSLSFDMDTKKSSTVASPPPTTTKSAESMIADLKKLKTRPDEFAAKINQLLRDPQNRETLIKNFHLDSPENKKALGIAMFLEAGEGLKSENMMPVGAVILNRTLANNLALAASGKKQVISISETIREKNQFAIKRSFNSALSGGGRNAVHYGTGKDVNAMVEKLFKGNVGSHPSAANAFFFQRATLRHQTFTAGRHSFSPTPSNVQYVNGNYLVKHNGNNYHK